MRDRGSHFFGVGGSDLKKPPDRKLSLLNMGSQTDLLTSWLCHLLAMCPWTSHFTLSKQAP